MKIEVDLTDFLEDFVADSSSRRYSTWEQRQDEVRQLVHAAQSLSDSWGIFAEVIVKEMGENAKEYLMAALGQDEA